MSELENMMDDILSDTQKGFESAGDRNVGLKQLIKEIWEREIY